MDFDAILTEVGDFGRYQLILIGLLCFPATFSLPFTFMGQLFQTVTPDHWCHVPEFDNTRLTAEEIKAISIPLEDFDGIPGYSRCRVFERNYSEILFLLETNVSLNITSINRTHNSVKCQYGWDYDFERFRPTATSELNWVCDDEWKSFVSMAIFFVGSSLGALLFGYISDKYGRLPACLISNAVACLSTLGTAFSQEFISFSVMRFIAGLSFDATQMALYVLVLEYVGSTYRTVSSNITFGIFFTAGGVCLPWLAYVIPDWRYFCLVSAIPFGLILPFYKIIPESARWLITCDRVDDALHLLKTISKYNKKQIKDEFWERTKNSLHIAAQEEKRRAYYSVMDLLRYPRLRTRLVLIILTWFVLMLTYDTLVRNTENFGWDVYISSTLGNATELPAAFLAAFLMDRLGRRWLMIGGYVLSAFLFFGILGLPSGMTFLFMAIAVSGRLCVGMLMNVFIQYKVELLPTAIRGQGISIAHLLGFAGSVLSPFIVYLGRYKRGLPFIIFGGLSLIGGIIVFFIPETLYESLPDSLEDGEYFGEGQSYLYFPKQKKSEEKVKHPNVYRPKPCVNWVRRENYAVETG